ncbi:Grx4 family monothiol glutaredoxin [Luteimonas sp. SX5]|uniref:Grx4 family monothiol glutaredoxin n=1 Tax=Luteimonas galliterrae TaxID=2940486 RepID=A0ABT0MNB1_9GAMM|nr:Grx4 family monothiol glutaredoxin [Luteimonas galliterrae]MCL1635749.1 Grx4 family monothiol glutaredoxin [Luteimonas galliterrae]
MALEPALRQRIEALLQSNRVVLFMKGSPAAPQCGFSAKAVAALDALGVDYTHSDVLADGDIREGIKTYGEWPTIPQLYIDGQLVGGSDIIEQMANSGELHGALGLPPPDRTPPTINITPAAAKMLRDAIDDAGGEVVVRLDIDKNFRTRLQLAQDDPNAITAQAEGVRVQFDLAGARRAQGLTIDWADDARGRGLVIDNPNAPAPVRGLSPAEAHARIAAGTLVLVDVRPPDERAQAAVAATFETLDGDGLDRLRALPKSTALAFLCHHGGRSAQAAEHFRGLGFGEVYNIEGGIDAWANDVDPALPRY